SPISEKWALGVDIGGTNVKAGLVNQRGEVMLPEHRPTSAAGGAKSIAAATEKVIAAILAANAGERMLGGIGIASAGAIDVSRGTVFAATENLPGWTGFPLRTHFAEKFGVPVFVENDAHAAALAELEFGAGRELKDFVVVTLGTGLGGGIIANRQLLRGFHGFGGAIGHHTINFESGPCCNCGRRGCLESYVSSNALVRDYCAATGTSSTTAEEIARRAAQGDVAANGALDRMAAALGEGLANVWNFVDPEAVILTGGITQALSGFQNKLMMALNRSLPFSTLRKPRVLFSMSNVFTGVQGAAAAVFQR
ncbi:MAG TPA: ROK family protein, partial [Acidobacteriaceae bacterium]|nr:ROK family protein [Acidobacteriaceae bacterium]